MISLLLLLFVVCSTIGAQKSDPNDRRLKVYKPSDTCRTAIIVCPGGSYCWLSKKYEGTCCIIPPPDGQASRSVVGSIFRVGNTPISCEPSNEPCALSVRKAIAT